MLDNDGYPTEDTLERIKSWKYEEGYDHLMEYISDNWYYPNYFRGPRTGSGGSKWYRISTGGWSGNESVIAAMKSNHLFWMICWAASRRGGHFVFEVK